MTVRNMSKLLRLLEIRRYQEATRRQDFGIAVRREQTAARRRDLGRDVLGQAQHDHRARIQAGALSLPDLKQINQRLLFGERQLDLLRRQFAKQRDLRQAAQHEYQLARRRSKSLERLEERQAEAKAQEQRRQEQRQADEVALRRFVESTARQNARTGSESKENLDE